MSRAQLGWWEGKRVPRARRPDVLFVAALVLLGAGALAAGHRTAAEIRPARARALSGFLDDLERPRRLPDAPIVDGTGAEATLLERLGDERGVVAFYAPWCGPCQAELPELVELLGEERPLVVMTSSREDPEETRRKLDNLGLEELAFHVDTTGAIHEAGRVDALPTTFVLTPRGEVLERFEGARFVMMWRIEALLGLEDG